MPSPRLALTRTYLAPTPGSAQESALESAPGGGELPGVADVRPEVEVTSEETHWDTSDLALAAAGVSVRRQTAERTSPAPRGWVLELPGRGPRTRTRSARRWVAPSAPHRLRCSGSRGPRPAGARSVRSWSCRRARGSATCSTPRVTSSRG